MRYFFHIAYQGTHFSGWQKLPGIVSVQDVIEKALLKVLKTPVFINGCGRTDSQVHASQYFFHADLELPNTEELKFRLNKTLPQSIAIFDIIEMHDKAHARFDAVQRKYDYFLHTYKNPFIHQQSSYYDIQKLNLLEMKKAVNLLSKHKDYKSFCTQPNKYEHTICNVMEADLFVSKNEDTIRFNIASNRFLSKMIRILMGKLLKVGKNELSLAAFEEHLIALKPFEKLEPAHPTGLYLSKVSYPKLNIPTKPDFIPNISSTEWYSI